MARKGGLGKGLDSLITSEYTKKVDKSSGTRENTGKFSTKNGENVEKPVEKAKSVLEEAERISVIKIEPNRNQPRKSFDEDAMQELAESIRQMGILQPLLVKPVEDHYVIVAGERRWRAAKLAGLKEVPAIIRNYSDEEIMELSLIENIQREDLNVIEEAKAYQRLLTEFGYRQEDLANKISKSRSSITNRLRLLKLSEEVQRMVEEGKISEGHARALIPVENAELQYEAATRVIDNNMSVRETEKMVKKLLAGPREDHREDWKKEDQFVYDKLEEDLRSLVGTKVTIQRKNKDKGKIVIDYYSPEELERLMELFRKM